VVAGRLKAEVNVDGTWRACTTTTDGAVSITLPLDKNGNRIADDWENDWEVADRAANADKDLKPEDIGDPNEPGDGFSLYEEYRVALAWLAGLRDLPATPYIRLLPPSAPPRHQLSPPATTPPPVTFTAPANWPTVLELRRQDQPTAPAQPWSSGWKIVTAPKTTSLQIQPGNFHQLSCVVEAASAPPPGAIVTATVKLGDVSVTSAPLTVPPPPADEREAKLNGIAAALAVGDAASVLAVADRWIAAEPNRHEGYWCRGQALEAKGDTAGALAAYRAALERYPKPADIGSGWEPPTRLWRKLAALEK
jgi:tetratricopeptide (TPR) repeat protein